MYSMRMENPTPYPKKRDSMENPMGQMQKNPTPFFPIAVLAGLSMAGPAWATDYDIGAGGNWATDTTWNSPIAGGPLSTDSINITSILGARTVAMSSAYTITNLSYNETDTVTFNFATSPLTITGNLTKNGTGILNFSRSNAYFGLNINGDLVINNGDVRLNDAINITVGGSTRVEAGATLQLRAYSNNTLGSTTLNGTLNYGLTPSNFGGGLTFNGLAGASTGAILTGQDLPLANEKSVNIALTQTSGTYDFAGGISEGTYQHFQITKSGAGTQIFSGANTYNGATTISAGTLDFAKQAALYNGTASSWTTSNISVASSAVLAVGVGASASGYFDATAIDTLRDASHLGASTATVGFKTGAIFGFDTTNATAGTFTYSSNIGDLGTSATNGLAKLGSGSLVLSGANTYTGTTTVTSGTLAYGINQATPTASATVINATAASGNAILDLAGYNSTISSLLTFGGATAGANATNTLSTGTGTLTLGTNVFYTKATLAANDPGTATISGNLALSGGQRTFVVDDSTNTTNELDVTAVVSSTNLGYGVTKKSAGTMTLSAANTYNGPTYIQEGILSINSIGNVNGGASALGAPTTAAYGTISLGYTTTTGQLTYTGGASTTDRVIDLRSDTGGGIIDQSGTGLLKFTSNLTSTGAGIKTLTLQGSTAGTGEIGGIIRDNSGVNTTSLVKAGTGTWALSGANSYTGATTVNTGTLAVTGTGSINTSSGVSVSGASSMVRYDSSVGLTRNVTVASGGTFAYNSSANYSGALTFTNGKLGGTNWNGSSLGGLTIGANQTIAPGNSPGTATTTTQTWAGGGSYNWEINNVAGTAGFDPGWDLVNFSTGLNITANAGDKFTINVISLTLANASGDTTGFDSGSSYQWLIADSATEIASFSTSYFNINTAGFTNDFTGTFALALGDTDGIGGDNTQLYLTYISTAEIPEPSTAALIGGAFVLLVACRRRRI